MLAAVPFGPCGTCIGDHVNHTEAPIKIEHHFTSTVSVKSIKGMLVDTFGIFYRLQLLHAYDYDIAEFAGE